MRPCGVAWFLNLKSAKNGSPSTREWAAIVRLSDGKCLRLWCAESEFFGDGQLRELNEFNVVLL